MLRTNCLHVCLHIDWSPYCTFNGTLNNIKHYRSREFYDMYRSQIIDSNETMHSSNFLASYCAADKHDW